MLIFLITFASQQNALILKAWDILNQQTLNIHIFK